MKLEETGDAYFFEDRLENFLPQKEWLTLQDITEIEDKVINFSIPRLVQISLNENYFPLDMMGPRIPL